MSKFVQRGSVPAVVDTLRQIARAGGRTCRSPCECRFAAGGPPSAFAAKAANATIPVVFSAVNHPVELGLVASLNRPGGNLTGMSMFTAEIAAKNVSLLKEMVPSVTIVAYLINPTNPAAKIYSDSVVAAANALGITARIVNASKEQDLDDAFTSSKNFGAAGLVVIGEPFFDTQRDKIVALAQRYALPAIYTFREYVTAGGLMSYGPSRMPIAEAAYTSAGF
jgi:putative ABC transport system substrate-binding protein